MFWNSVNIISFWSSLLFIYFFLLVWFLVLSSGLKFLTIFINCDVHVCHGHLLEANVFVLLTCSHVSLSAVDLGQHRCELCRPTYMQIISVVNTTLLHGPMVESADTNNVRCGGPTIKLRADFQLHSGSVPLIPSPCCSRVSCTTFIVSQIVSDSCCIFPVPAQQSGISLGSPVFL